MVFNCEHDTVYHANCEEKSYSHDYVGESCRRVLVQVKYRNGRDTFSHIFKHGVAADHQFLSNDELRIVCRN